MTKVAVHEVGTRDGLQSAAVFVPTELKKAWISDEFRAGVRAFDASLGGLGDQPFHGAIARAGLPKGYEHGRA